MVSQSATPGHKTPFRASWRVKDQLVVVFEPATQPESEGRQRSQPTVDRIGQLERLAALREKGVLTDEEFETEKLNILRQPSLN